MIRRAQEGDIAAVRGFLEGHAETSLFLLSNLEAHGLGRSQHPKATRYHLVEESGRITGVFGCTSDGDLMCQMPDITPEAAQAFVQALQGHPVCGMTGVTEQVEQVRAALALPEDSWQMDEVEPLYRLALEDLPDTTEQLRHPAPEDHALLEDWFRAYYLDTGLATGARAEAEAVRRTKAAIGSSRHVLMIEAGVPVAMSQCSVRAGTAVQIGGVFVPEALRGRGRAGRVVAAHLHRQRDEGYRTAILFAASTEAARAYERIGFRHIGSYRVAMLKEKITLGTGA